ncbi:MAG: 2-hydroxyacyl-CoA dehydratase family protein [Firmicutes bacterium]|nr:2-hydroxyacyl-CoA dehydratase family protein [Bacillota bacterium]
MMILGKERSEELAVIYESLVGMRELMSEDPDSKALNAFLKGAVEYMEKIFRAMDENGIVIAYNAGVSPELLRCFGDDVVAIPQEAFPVLQSLLGDPDINARINDYAVAQGLPADICSTNRLANGYLLKGLYPEITCAVFHSSPCDNQKTVGPVAIKEMLGRPIFHIDIPHFSSQREHKYVAAQFKEEIKFLEKQLGRKFSWERMRSVCEESNKMMEKIVEWNQLRRTIPLPQSSKISCLMVLVMLAFSGQEEGTYIMSEFAAECEERIARGESSAPDGEKIRAAWFVDALWQDLSLYDWMEMELGLVVPIDLFGYMATGVFLDTSTQDSMLESLARKCIETIPMIRQINGDYEPFIGDWMRMISDFKADCGIFGGHVGCRGSAGVLGLAKEAFREANIPLLVLEYDFLDNRVTSSEDLQMEITRFVNDVVLPRKVK